MPRDVLPLATLAAVWWCAVSIARIISDNRIRTRALDAKAPPETVAAVLAPPRRDPGLAGSLKWGIVLTSTSLAIVIVGFWRLENSPLAVGFPLLGAGLGLLLYYGVARAIERQGEGDGVTEGNVHE
jgi:hypothetical protein